MARQGKGEEGAPESGRDQALDIRPKALLHGERTTLQWGRTSGLEKQAVGKQNTRTSPLMSMSLVQNKGQTEQSQAERLGRCLLGERKATFLLRPHHSPEAVLTGYPQDLILPPSSSPDVP